MNRTELIEMLGGGIEFAGVAIIVAGLFLAAFGAARESGSKARFERARRELGHAILLGLEVLVAADIVRTVALAPTLEGVAVLALIVLIRSFLSWSLALELEGRWPWQRKTSPATPHAQPQPTGA
jgi:uncharacterized membrane protein